MEISTHHSSSCVLCLGLIWKKTLSAKSVWILSRLLVGYAKIICKSNFKLTEWYTKLPMPKYFTYEVSGASYEAFFKSVVSNRLSSLSWWDQIQMKPCIGPRMMLRVTKVMADQRFEFLKLIILIFHVKYLKYKVN